MSYQDIIKQYCRFGLENDIAMAKKLFAKDAKIISPTLGTQTVDEFLAFIDKTKRTEIVLNELFTSQSNPRRIAAYITVDSLWQSGTAKVSIEAIDVFEFDENSKIKRLEMYYDSHAMRNFLEPLNNM
jgi:hypothetical protein